MEKNSSYSLLQLFLSRVKRLFPSEVGTKKMSPRSSSNSFESSTTFTLHFIREIVINLKRCLLEVPLKNISSIVGKKKKEKKRKERNNIRFRGKATALISNRVTTVSFPRRQGNNSPHDVMEFDERQRIVELFPRLKKRLLITFINSFKL